MNSIKLPIVALVVLFETFAVAGAQTSLKADFGVSTFSKSIGIRLKIDSKILKLTAGESISNREIRRILRREGSFKTVGGAIAMKRRGLYYVDSFADFVLLTTYAFTNPSRAYKEAVSKFIVENHREFFERDPDFRSLNRLEQRAFYVNQARVLKETGLPYVRTLREFGVVTRPAYGPGSASLGYRQMVSNFIGLNIFPYVEYGDRLSLLLRIEANTYYVKDSMSVKKAGLSAVITGADFWQLTEYAFSSPSQAYINAVDQFIRRYERDYGYLKELD